MESYRLVVSASAEKVLKKIPKKDLGKIVAAIQSLAQNPFPPMYRKLAGEESVYRIRQGNYRIIYEIVKKQLIIHILKIGHRKDVYRS